MELYAVPVCNELTGEMQIVSVSCGSSLDAQIEALRLVFRNQGWHKARALQAERVEAEEREDGAVA
ncbi:MAG TPA: hypothetical protein VF221_04960 [Chloroflexota bacterium]